jgi:hypothetical protein
MRANAESGAACSVRYSGCASRAASSEARRSTPLANWGSALRTSASGQRAVGDEGARLAALDDGLGGAESEVLDRDELAASGDGVEVVAQRPVAAREAASIREEAHGRGDDGRRRRVAAKEKLSSACRGHGAHSAREERVDEARVYERLGATSLAEAGSEAGEGVTVRIRDISSWVRR